MIAPDSRPPFYIDRQKPNKIVAAARARVGVSGGGRNVKESVALRRGPARSLETKGRSPLERFFMSSLKVRPAKKTGLPEDRRYVTPRKNDLTLDSNDLTRLN